MEKRCQVSKEHMYSPPTREQCWRDPQEYFRLICVLLSSPSLWESSRDIPLFLSEWYPYGMSGTYPVVVGDRGRIVVPIEVRESAGLAEGTPLVLLDTPGGLVLLTREQLLARVRRELEGLDMVSELLADRRRSAEQEDAA